MQIVGSPINLNSANIKGLNAVFDGSHWRAYADGTLTLSSTELHTILNDELFNALNVNRSSHQMVTVEANQEASIDGTISLESNLLLKLSGNFKVADAVNADIFVNADQATNNYNVCIEGPANINGNGANQSNGKLFNFTNATNIIPTFGTGQQYPSALMLKRLNFENPRKNAIYINFAGSSGSTLKMQDVQAYGVGLADSSYLVHLQQIYDSNILDCFFSGDSKCLFGQALASVKFRFDYFNGCALLDSVRKCELSATYWDNSDNLESLTFNWSHFNTVHNTVFNRVGSSGYTGPHAIKMNPYNASVGCTNNKFLNIDIGRHLETGTNRFDYGIIEADQASNDSNQFCNINAYDCAGGALYLRGTTSKLQHQNIIGTVTKV